MPLNPQKDISFVIPVWVKLPHIPLHCWNDEYLRAIGKSLRKFIDKSYLKPLMFLCTRICVEFDLEKGLQRLSIYLWMDGITCKQWNMNKFLLNGIYSINMVVLLDHVQKGTNNTQNKTKRKKIRKPRSPKSRHKKIKFLSYPLGK